MKNFVSVILLVISASLAAPVYAASKSVTLSVPGMNCAVCPITVKKALNGVKGVKSVTVDFDGRKAAVTFDDAKTSVEALTRATADAGYPSTLIQ